MRIESLSTRRILAPFLVVAFGVGAAACSHETKHDGLSVGTTIDTSTTMGNNVPVDTETTTTDVSQDDMSNPFNPTAKELAYFSCLDPKNEKYGIEINEVDGTQFVAQVLPAQIPVEIEKKDFYHREDSNSLDSPFTVDLTNKAEVEAELAANLCAKPALEAAYIGTLTRIATLVGLEAPMLKEFVGKTGDEISAMITNPHNEATFPADKAEKYKLANLEATKKREALAEYIVAVLNTLQKRGNVKGLQLHSDYALNIESNFNPTEPAKFAEDDYTGDVYILDYTFKGSDCVDHRVSIGINTGATTPEGVKDDGDKRPVIIIKDVKCDKTVPTTTVHENGTTTTIRVNDTTTTTIHSDGTTTTTTEPRYDLSVCDLDQKRNEGGYGVVVHYSNLTAPQRDAILADPMNKSPYTSLHDSNGDGQEICK